ncbi:MAG TPA: hypothetical protein DCM26_04760 [Desulfotomaculum sp.]|nr:hypothetical protein [Desulfotomaculum sp.]
MDRHLRMLSKYKKDLLGLPNVLGVGVGFKQMRNENTGRPALLVFVENKVHLEGLRKEHIVPLKIKDLQTDVIEIGRVRMLQERTRRWRPAQPGVSIGHHKISAGTFGTVVKDKTTGEKLILSNNHILANATDGSDGRSAAGDPVLQPGPHDGGGPHDRIATLLRFIPVRRTVQDVECPVAAAAVWTGNTLIHAVRPHYDLKLTKRAQELNLVDAAVARPDAQNMISGEILGIGHVEGVADIGPGEQVQKSGRTSGVTEGKVQAIGVTVRVDIVDAGTGWFSDQVISDVLSRPGDSGSLVLNSEKRAVGLLFAGSDKYTVFNRIHNVMERLRIQF